MQNCYLKSERLRQHIAMKMYYLWPVEVCVYYTLLNLQGKIFKVGEIVVR